MGKMKELARQLDEEQNEVTEIERLRLYYDVNIDATSDGYSVALYRDADGYSVFIVDGHGDTLSQAIEAATAMLESS